MRLTLEDRVDATEAQRDAYRRQLQCRVLFFPCPSRTAAFVAGAAATGAFFLFSKRGL